MEGIAKELGAEVYNESPGSVCILPDDARGSVTGRGASVADAVTNWDSKLQAHLRNASHEDPVVLFVKAHLARSAYEASNRKVKKTALDEKPQHVMDFENQVFSGKKPEAMKEFVIRLRIFAARRLNAPDGLNLCDRVYALINSSATWSAVCVGALLISALPV